MTQVTYSGTLLGMRKKYERYSDQTIREAVTRSTSVAETNVLNVIKVTCGKDSPSL